MLATALSASIVGVDGVPVHVEVDVAFGLPGLTIVGLAGSAVLEARERVRAALRNSGFEVPSRRITINLAPASGTKTPRKWHSKTKPLTPDRSSCSTSTRANWSRTVATRVSSRAGSRTPSAKRTAAG